MAARFKMAPGFEQALMRSNIARDILQEPTEEIAARARQLAPDDPSTGDPDIKSQIEAVVGMGPRGWVGRVIANNFKSHWWEAGHQHPTQGFRQKAFLRPAAEEVVGPLEGGR